MIKTTNDIHDLLHDTRQHYNREKLKIRRFDTIVFAVYSLTAGMVWCCGHISDLELLKQSILFGALIGGFATIMLRQVTANDFPDPKDEVRLPELAVEMLADIPALQGPNPFLTARNTKGFVTLRQAEAFIPRLAI